MQRPIPKDEAIELDFNKIIISKTDPRGIITYVNDYFLEVSGYSEGELIGKPHSIVRHPDMPKIAFKLMWDRIAKGKPFTAAVKNLAKDGRYYWVIARLDQVIDPETKKVVGHTAVSEHTAFRTPAPAEIIQQIEPIYKKLVEIENSSGIKASYEYLDGFLHANNTTYDEFIEGLVTKKGFLDKLQAKFGKIFRR